MRKGWIAAAAAVALGVAYFAGGTRRVHAQNAPTTRTWPPPPSSIVNLTNYPESMTKKIRLANGEHRTLVYEVPAGKTLVVTDVYLDPGPLILYEDRAGKTTTKLSQAEHVGIPARYHSAVGLVFGSGAKIAAERTTESFNLTGYLTDP